MLSALQLLKNQVKAARETFEGTVEDVSEKQLQKNPGGVALPLGAIYAHLIYSEDTIINSMLQQKEPLYKSAWKEKTGINKPMPPMDANWSDANKKWSKTVKINLVELRKYSKAVYLNTDKFLDGLKEKDVDKEIDLGTWGKQSLSELLTGFIIGHTYSITGEISALKGLQGAKGYPF